jgi:mannose-1-phosphate guanylyltransferase
MTSTPARDGLFCLFLRRSLSEIRPVFPARDHTLKAFLLAGGHGTRLRPLTDSIPKCLVPIRGRPLLDIWLELCARSGITEVLVNLHAHSQPIEQHLKRSSSPVDVRLVREDELLGSAGTVAANRAWVGSESAFWILYSDVLTNTNLNRISEFHSRHGALATLGLYQVPDPSRCGVAIVDHMGVIIEFEEKPQIPRSNWVFSGLMIADRRLFDVIPPGIPADLAFHVLPRLLGAMRGFPIEDYLLDIGTMSNYQKAQITWPGLEGDACSRPGERADPGAPRPANGELSTHRMSPGEIS